MNLTVETKLDAFAEFCERHLTLENGNPLILEEFQRDLLRPYFGGFVETCIILPKKNGKTALVSALGLYELVNSTNAEIFLAAAARDQAGKMLGFAHGFVHRSPWLQQYVKVQPGHLRVISLSDLGYMKVVPGDPKTVDGVTPTLAFVDEYHRHASSELYSLLRDGLTARGGKLISISTAGDSEDSPLGKLRQSALKLPGVVTKKCHTVAINDDRTFAFHEWALGDEDDHEDFEKVKLANPLSIHSVDSLRTRYASPSVEPWQWARFTCGLWVGGENAAIDAIAWRKCGGGAGLEAGESCWVGIDLGWRRDSTALVPYTYDDEEKLEVVGVPTIIAAPQDGGSTSYRAVIEALRLIHQRNPVERVVIDPNAEANIFLQMVAEDDELYAIKVEHHSQDPSPMAKACMGLAEAVRATSIVHPDDKELTAHMLAAGAKTVSGEQWRFVKQKGGRKIDGAVALAMVRAKRLAKPKRRDVRVSDFSLIPA